MARLSDDAIEAALRDLNSWKHADGALVRTLTFPTFPAGIAFVNRVATVAEEVGHHPDMTIQYATITLRLSTHDAGGITEKDIDLARRIDGLEQK
jgi:4a-hydroxytetrahydrobiopterin dehydratase